MITGILGIAEADVEMYRGWVDDLIGLDTGVERKGEVLESLIGFIGELIAQRRAATTDDLLSTMVNARDEGDQLSEEELISLVLTLFLAGFETTAAQIGSTLYALMAHPDLWRELRDDRSLMPAATEELWRWIPSFRFGMPMVRWAKEDVELSGGVVVPAGEPVVPEHQVANRDESVFPHGWELDFHRDNPSPHLSLAFGAHRSSRRSPGPARGRGHPDQDARPLPLARAGDSARGGSLVAVDLPAQPGQPSSVLVNAAPHSLD